MGNRIILKMKIMKIILAIAKLIRSLADARAQTSAYRSSRVRARVLTSDRMSQRFYN